MSFQVVGILFNKGRGLRIATFTQENRGADESCNVGGKRRRRVPGSLFPALLLSNRSIADEVGSALANEIERVEVGQPFLAV